jgi:hypothetical protein
MRKFCAVLLSLVMLVPSVEAGPKGGGGGGSSWGGGSSGRPSGGGSSWGGGSSARPSGGGSSSGGSSSGGSNGKPSGGPASKPAPSGGSSWGGGSKPSGGGSSSSQPRSSWGGGSSPPAKQVTTKPIEGKTPTSVSKKPAAPTYDKLAVADSKKAESRAKYEKATAPAPTYKTPKGDSKPIPTNDPEVNYLRGRLDGERWASRSARYDAYYAPYVSRPLVLYGDPYAPYWHYRVMDMGLDIATLWMYHHMATLDAGRRDAMYAQNAELRARVAALERQGLRRDPTYTPPGVDPDVAYNDGFVNASYNPTPRTIDEYEYDDDGGGYRFWHWVWVCIKWTFYLILAVCAIYIVAYLLFNKRYNV